MRGASRRRSADPPGGRLRRVGGRPPRPARSAAPRRGPAADPSRRVARATARASVCATQVRLRYLSGLTLPDPGSSIRGAVRLTAAVVSIAVDAVANQLYVDPGDIRVVIGTLMDEPI